MVSPQESFDAANGGEAAKNKLYTQFTETFDAASTYIDDAHPEIKKILGPLIAAMPQTKEEFFSVPNALSLVGFLLVVDGARHLTTKEGVLKIAAGRGLDVADGIAARRLNQTSNFGALTDVMFDKAGMAIIATEAWQQRALPRELLLSVGANQMASATLTYTGEIGDARDVDTSTRATKLGKYSMALELSALVGLLWTGANEREKGVEHPNLRGSHWYKATLGAEALRWCAVAGYASRFLQTRRRKRDAHVA